MTSLVLICMKDARQALGLSSELRQKLQRRCALLAALALACGALSAAAKEPSLAAIELYDGPSGAAYLQLGEVLINGKAELRDCSQFQGQAMEKSAYGKLPRVTLAPGATLERGADGVLRYSDGGRSGVCVAPVGIKFEHNATYSLSDLAEQAALHGTPIGVPAATPVPPLKNGVKLVFIAAPNVEMAEYLRAQRASDIDGWKGFLEKYPAASNLAEAKHALAALYLSAGEKALTAYRKSTATDTPSYADLKQAEVQADLALSAEPTLDSAIKLKHEVSEQLTDLSGKGSSEIQAYREALSSHKPGYRHLETAKKLSDAIKSVDGGFAPGQQLADEVAKDANTYDAAMQKAGELAGKKQAGEMDEAGKAIAPYTAFSAEEPRVSGVIDSMYAFYMQQGNAAAQAQDWQGAVDNFGRAEKAKPSPQSQNLLKNATQQLAATQNAAAAKEAQARSSGLEQQKDFIGAYETLANLPPDQRKLVADDMQRLAPDYVKAAAQKAMDLRKAHSPIQGIQDGYELENAYAYLEHAYALSQDPNYQDTMAVLANELSEYFLNQAKHYLDKPEGSGTELGWAYLQEALSYRASNQTAVRDQRTGAEQAHAMHSRLSLLVQFRDGTSQRDSAGFAGQLENAIIRGLETSSIQVKAFRFGEITSAKPDFQLVGDVLEHHVSETPSPETVESVFYTGSTEDKPNDDWNRANREYVSATQDLSTAQARLQGAETKGKKKEIDDARSQVSLYKQKANDALAKRDALPTATKTPINHSYTYTRNTIDYQATVQLQFRLDETLSGQRGEYVPVVKSDHQTRVVLEGVSAEDIKGVKPSGTKLDKNEMQAALERTASDALIDAVRARVESLPKSIYDSARKKEADEDVDGAAEAYLRFLHCTREDDSPERAHAREYLKTQFHLHPDTATGQ